MKLKDSKNKPMYKAFIALYMGLFLCLLIDEGRNNLYNVINNIVIVIVRRNLMLNVNELLEIAIKETENLTDGEIFLVKELFKGYEWNRILRNDRLLLGTLFLNYENRTDGSIQAIEKTTSGQQKYKMQVNK